ncbi:DUF2157 domain-containing protein [Microbulbifer rhizosphaerae]|uniref:Putative membrane protein n=1 Tax=Microbulbifer rhizosphaerae TaxID=1562603 RepID=A0A7W4ZB96_9GAMM|nr:DUF2157 domain-containing protein [Microbulbifer rhizosphaerae]MBB3063613.1 putative membrane protein [Microbulbifer rhizosphaerae]
MRLIRLLKNDLARETADWVAEGIVSREQAERICTRYGADFEQAQGRSLGYSVLTGLGYLFIGLALITLIGANWEEIPRALRMWGLIAITVATQGLALRRYLSGDEGGATGIFLLGNLFFGASIILIAQIYHLGEHMPDGVFWWALGCLPFAVLLRNPWLALQAGVLALVWFFLEVSLGFYPVLFPLFIAAFLWVLWCGRESILLLLLVVAGIGFWTEYSLAAWWRDSGHFDFRAENLAVGVALFIALYALGHWLAARTSAVARDYGAVLSIWSLRFGLVLMLVLSFAGPWEELIEAEWRYWLPMTVVSGLLAAIALVFAAGGGRLRATAGLLAFYFLSLLVAILVGNEEHTVYFQLVYNVALIGMGIWLIVRGIHSGISHYFFLGVTAILLTALMRYIDLIGDYIGGAAVFLLFAVLLLAAARYWRRFHSREGAV